MNFQVKTADLVGVTKLLAPLTEDRSPLLHLAYIKLVVLPERLTLTATNLQVGARISIDAETKSFGAALVPAKKFHQWVSAIKADSISGTLKAGKLTLKAGGSRATINVLVDEHAVDFPDPDFTGDTVFDTTSIRLSDAISRVSTAAAVEDLARPFLVGIWFLVHDRSLMMTSTDGYRLSTLQLSADAHVNSSFTVPSKAASSIQKLIKAHAGDDITCKITPSVAVFSSGDRFDAFAAILQYEYPDVLELLPREFVCQAEVERQDITEAVKRSMVFTQSVNATDVYNATFDITPDSDVDLPDAGSLVIRGQGEDGGVKETIPIAMTGDTLEMTFNLSFLNTALATFKDVQVELNFSDSGVIMKPTTSEDNYRYFILKKTL